MAVSYVAIWERSIEVLLILKPFRFFLEFVAFLKNWL